VPAVPPPESRPRPAARTAGVLAGLVVALAAGGARADKVEPPGSVVYVKAGALWRAPLASPDRAVKLADLPVAPALIRGIAAATDGSAALVDLGAGAAWIDLTTAGAAPVYLPCAGGRLGAGGDRVLCRSRAGKSGVVVIALRPHRAATPMTGVDVATAALVGAHGDQIVTGGSGALWLASLGHPGDRRRVAPHAPLDHLWIAPSGMRAVGRYQDHGEDSLYGFRLDGRAARRKLMPGHPVAWSADSTWLAVDSDDAGCVLRAVGGEYKCWDHYLALGLSPDGVEMLLGRPAGSGDDHGDDHDHGHAAGFDLYLAPVAGVRPDHPRPLLEGALAAALVP
jgi:hypothetical protein